MPALSPAEIAARLPEIPLWSEQNGALHRSFTFPDFVVAMGFVNRVAEAAESANHHPDIDIRYNKVNLALSSHDAGGITARDFELAARINRLS